MTKIKTRTINKWDNTTPLQETVGKVLKTLALITLHKELWQDIMDRSKTQEQNFKNGLMQYCKQWRYINKI